MTAHSARVPSPNPLLGQTVDDLPAVPLSVHPENCIGEWADEKHIQNGECYCDCPACTSPDGERCICVECDSKRCPDHA